MVESITSQQFKDSVLSGKGRILVDFSAVWCGPCRMLAPVIADFAEEHEGEVKVGKVNVDEQPELAARYNISSIPTVLVFKNGVLTNSAIGYRPKTQLEALI